MPGFQSTRLATEGALKPFFFLYTDDSIQGNPETCKQSSVTLNYEVKNTYARGDYGPDSDIDIMIFLDLSDMELKVYSKQLFYMTYDFNMDNDVDIKPIAKSEKHFKKWVLNYPFYANINKEGIVLYEAA